MRNLRSKAGLYNLDVALSGLAWRCQRLAVLPCLDQQPVDGIGWSGPGKQEPLHLVAAGRSRTRWCPVSTPSTSTDRPSARARATIAWMITPPLEERPSAATKLLSILSLSSGKRCKYPRLE